MTLQPVILCGGHGARLWPASSPAAPKQFLALLGPLSLFQQTVLRLRDLEGAAVPAVVAGPAHAATVRAQLAAIGAEAVLIIEPVGRDSGPALTAAALWARARDPGAVVVALASDHHVSDDAAFAASVQAAAISARAGDIVTFGVRPTAPATAYGYIQPGEARGPAGARAVARFVEKPGPEAAAAYVADGFLWNNGNFLFLPEVMIGELAHHAPTLLEAVRAAMPSTIPVTGTGEVRLGPAFAEAPKISIDYAVMEKTERAAVQPVAFGWSDLGTWDAVWAALKHDGDGNAVTGGAGARVAGSRDCLIDAGAATVVAAGLESVAVVVRPEGVLVCALAAAPGLKGALEGLAVPAPPPEGAAAAARSKLERWLFASALPLWWALGADHAGGGFLEALTMEAAPVTGGRRVRVQARQIYVYATAARLGWNGPWAQAVEHGLDFLMGRYRLESGLFRERLEAGGGDPDVAPSYEQAFVLLALSSAASVLPARRAELLDAAEALVAALRPRLDALGGACEVVDQPYQSNPNMHLMEAALAWADAGGGAAAEALADGLAGLAMERLIDPATGVLGEFFRADWTPAPGVAGQVWEPGHQFEWAWLLGRWAERRGDPRARAAAERLFDAGRAGVDPARGAAVNLIVDAADAATAPTARLWPQTEWLKAAAWLAARTQEPSRRLYYQQELAAAARGLAAYLDTTIPGLWWDRLGPDGTFVDEPARATSLYHVTAAVAELMATRE